MNAIRESIQIINVHKHFGKLAALNGINLSVKEGEVVVIIGPSGSGKSTLLRCINHLEIPNSGEIWINRERINGNQKQLNLLRSQIGIVFQHFNLYPHLSVLENVCLAPCVVKKVPRKIALEIGMRNLARVGIADKAQAFPHQLSGGQQQRVAIARALSQEPKIMLFDEPTSALDPEMIREVLDVMLDLTRDGLTMVVVTHEIGFAKAAASEVIFMDYGRLLRGLPPSSFFLPPPMNERVYSCPKSLNIK
jgi:ABC-type polar amino acid transport system ATPase subunit